MSRPRTKGILDQYELAVDEIVAACDGDVRGALRALILVNEQLEQRLFDAGAWLLTDQVAEEQE